MTEQEKQERYKAYKEKEKQQWLKEYLEEKAKK